MESISQSSSGSPAIQRPIIFMNELDLTDSELKRELQDWKPRQRQTPILEFDVQQSSFHHSKQEQLRHEYSKEERENIDEFFNTNLTKIPNSPEKNRPTVHDSFTSSQNRIPESPSINFQPNVDTTPKRKTISPPSTKLLNDPPIWKLSLPINNQPVTHDPCDSLSKMQKSPTHIQHTVTDFNCLESSSISDTNSADKTLTPQDFEEMVREDAESDKFEQIFKQLNRGIVDLRNSLTRNPTKHLSDSRLYDPQRYSDDQSLSTSSESRIVKQPKYQTIQPHSIGRAQAYSINTELHATFDFPTGSSKNEVEVCKTLARSFIDRTKEVYKLKVAIRSREVSNASSAGDTTMVKQLRAEEIGLVNEFNAWKKSTKNHYKQLLSLQKDTQSLRQTISDLQQKIKHAQKEANRLCNAIEAHEKIPMHTIPSVDKVVQTTGRLVQRQEPFKNLLNASNQQSENVLMQHSVQTASFLSQSYVEREVQQQRYNVGVEPILQLSTQQVAKTESSHNSSVVSLVEDENVLGVPNLPVVGSVPSESSPSRVPPLNFMPLDVQPMQPISDRANEERLSSAANTERDVSSISFDEIAHPPAIDNLPLEQQNESIEKEGAFPNSSSRTIDEMLANVDEVEIQNEALESVPRLSSQQIVNESVVEIEEMKEDFKPLEPTVIEPELVLEKIVSPPKSISNEHKTLSDKESIHSIEVQTIQSNAVETKDESFVEEVYVEHMTSDSVASELPSSAFDDSLANLDDPVQDSPQESNKAGSSVASSTVSSPRKSQKSGSSPSLKSPPSASDKSILRVKSFQISSEIPSSNGSKQSNNTSNVSSSTT